ncbi:MAG: hypothetical protein B7Z55_09510 [Planctomycetales bacterium 12-60-4]|nr:MAG: hypothetical protein B7Z55_09510 [Planctomycetales bacterium 12-60-4]
MWNLPQGEITFAVVEKPARKLNAVLLFDYGENQATIDMLLEKLNGALKDGGAEHTTETISDVEVQVFEFPKTDGNPYNKLAYFSAESYFVVASDVAVVKAVLERWEGGSDETLAKDEVFAYIFDKCATEDQEPAVKWYLDLIGLVKGGIAMVQGQNPQIGMQAGMALGFLPVLGLDALKGMGGGFDLGVGPYDSVSKTFIYAEQPPTGVMAAFQFPAIAQSPPKWVSADATMYVGLNWNVAEAYLAIESIIDSFVGPGSTAREIEKMATAEDGPQVHLRKDLLDNIEGKLNLVTLSSEEDDEDAEGPKIPAVTFTISLKDATAIKRVLDKASQTDGFPGEITEIEGETVYNLPLDGGQIMSIAVVGSDLAFSTTTSGLEAVIAGEARESLASSEDYKELAKHIPSKTSMMSFSQQDTQMQSAYEALKGGEAFNVEGFDLSKLPDFEALMKYAKPTATYCIPDENGTLFVGFSLADE